MRLTGQLCLILFLGFFVAPVSAAMDKEDSVVLQRERAWDQGPVNYRHPPYEQIEDWKSDARYRYDRNQSPSLWNRLISRVLFWLVSATEGMSWMFYFFIALAGITVLLLLLRILDVPVSGLFVMSRHVVDSNLHFQDEAYGFSSSKLVEMLNMFRENGAYREAVRIMFLLYLRDLQTRGLIAIKHFKTNFDYYLEIESRQEKNLYRKRMRLFDVVWYGHADISTMQYEEVEKAFGQKSERGKA